MVVTPLCKEPQGSSQGTDLLPSCPLLDLCPGSDWYGLVQTGVVPWTGLRSIMQKGLCRTCWRGAGTHTGTYFQGRGILPRSGGSHHQRAPSEGMVALVLPLNK